MAIAGLGLGLVCNPLWSGEPVGPWPILNGLWLLYGPTILALSLLPRWQHRLATGLTAANTEHATLDDDHAGDGGTGDGMHLSGQSRVADRHRSANLGRVIPFASVLSMLTMWWLAMLLTRQGYAGSLLTIPLRGGSAGGGWFGQLEWYTYSAVSLLFGAGLLVAGIVWRRSMPRVASLLIVTVTVGKVFLGDLAELDGLLRVASFFGLGVSLVAIGFVYRKWLLPARPRTDGGDTNANAARPTPGRAGSAD